MFRASHSLRIRCGALLCLPGWCQEIYRPHVNTTSPRALSQPPSTYSPRLPRARGALETKNPIEKDSPADSVNPHAHPMNWVACVWVFSSPSLKSEQISDNKEVKRWIDNYLGVGEWVMDQSVAVMGSSSWFERRR
ncbi:hypothetical protein F1880_000637 [Penicillium rolfsii]|nr:hypothetical protein F1880_000637 [Penicillium rolfsii]